MKKTIKRFFSLTLTIILAFGVIVANSKCITCEAASFTPRTSLPSNARTTIPQFIQSSSENPYTSFNVGNCTWYAFGRAWEILGYRPAKLIFQGDAVVWFNKNKSNYDNHNGGFAYSTNPAAPKLGAIACFSDDRKTDGTGGHVAVVEERLSDGTIKTSESGYGSFYFNYNTRKTTTKGLGWSNYTFQGYIYLGDYSPTPPITTPPTNAWIQSDKTTAQVGEAITFSFAADGATSYVLGAVQNGNTTVFYPGANTSYTATFDKGGYYWVHAQCFNSYGYTDSPEIPIYVYDSAPVNGWIQSDKTTVRVGEEITFTYGAQGATHYYLGAVQNGNTTVFSPNSSTSYTATFDKGGYYRVHAQCFNSYGYTDSPEIPIFVYDTVPVNAWVAASYTTVKVGEPITFTYGAQGACSFAFNYSINNNLTTVFIGPDTQYTTSFDSPGTYITHITNYNEFGLTDSQDIVITVYDTKVILGDADGDGEIGLKDVVQITRYLAGGWDVTLDLAVADVNHDGEVNLKDAVILRRYLAGGWGIELK